MFEVCKRCYMPSTRPTTVFKEGVCQACINFDTRHDIDWNQRMNELREICDKYRSKDGRWDCVIPVSGGKDSHAQVYWMKEVMKMHPLLVKVADPFTSTKAGLHNFHNIGETFNSDKYYYILSPDFAKRNIRYCFEKCLDPLRYIEQVIHILPYSLTVKLGIPLHFKGEDSFVYGSVSKEHRDSNHIINRELSDFPLEFWLDHGFKREELNAITPPSPDEMHRCGTLAIPMSYYLPWSSVSNLQIARKYGFKDLTHEWKREGCMEDFEQIDSMGYVLHLWLKYPKFGFQRTSDIASRRLREGAITRNEAKRLIAEKDPLLDQGALDDFCHTLGYTRRQFWEIVDKFWNPKIFERDGVSWRMKIRRFPD